LPKGRDRTKPNDLKAIRELAAIRLVLRISLAVTITFGLAEYYDRQFSFLAPFLAVQLLVALPLSPRLVQAVVIPAVIFVSAVAAQMLSVLFSGALLAMLGFLGLVIFLTFYGLRRGLPSGLILLVQMPFCFVPVLATIDDQVPTGFSDDLVWGAVAAMIAVFAAHALFPSPLTAAQVAALRQTPVILEPPHAARIALTDSMVLLPLLVWFVVAGREDNVVILMIMLSLLRAIRPDMTGRMALGILGGNVLGGIIAVAVHQFLILSDYNFFLFLLTILAAGLWFGSRIAWGGERAPIFAIAFGTFLLILGLGIAPLFGGSEELFSVRILKIALASLYAIGALSLVMPLRQERQIEKGA
jgi:hypothetical protein